MNTKYRWVNTGLKYYAWQLDACPDLPGILRARSEPDGSEYYLAATRQEISLIHETHDRGETVAYLVMYRSIQSAQHGLAQIAADDGPAVSRFEIIEEWY